MWQVHGFNLWRFEKHYYTNVAGIFHRSLNPRFTLVNHAGSSAIPWCFCIQTEPASFIFSLGPCYFTCFYPSPQWICSTLAPSSPKDGFSGLFQRNGCFQKHHGIREVLQGHRHSINAAFLQVEFSWWQLLLQNPIYLPDLTWPDYNSYCHESWHTLTHYNYKQHNLHPTHSTEAPDQPDAFGIRIDKTTFRGLATLVKPNTIVNDWHS